MRRCRVGDPVHQQLNGLVHRLDLSLEQCHPLSHVFRSLVPRLAEDASRQINHFAGGDESSQELVEGVMHVVTLDGLPGSRALLAGAEIIGIFSAPSG
ncbi:hypothetical protein [Aerobium aerolatum]|uniref:hypothetical protein n=1 Tax=Aerobium aerolatum TaxID=561088 RepID=UPI001113DF5F|nr:hypothetical protein [Aquamicrobium aerolatum]